MDNNKAGNPVKVEDKIEHVSGKPYFIVLLTTLFAFNAAYYLTKSLTVSLISQLVLTSLALLYYRKEFAFRIKFDILAIIAGIVIFAAWVFLEGRYPLLGTSENTAFSAIELFLKLIIGVALIPVVEEFFTRFFLSRWIISTAWDKVMLGAYGHASFILTTLFFGFSHSRWLPGIITGVILNVLYYKRKNIESCILAHAVANLALGIFVIYFSAWQFWS
jgi:CAAX prenyl protease-like protein